MNRQQQIITVHAAFINEVVQCLLSRERQNEFKQLMQAAEQNGWTDLTQAIQRIKAGRRDMELLNPLDEEDRVIAEAILLGLQDPTSLPDPNAKADPSMAAPGLATMIHAAASGNAQALQLIANMAEQMSRAGGSMAKLAAVIRPMINGERDPERLCRQMDSRTEEIVLGILHELQQLENA
ncbi:MAG: hypothetical protein PVI52_02105 [Chromatiales bacterium]|jgi:hypothetical protein